MIIAFSSPLINFFKNWNKKSVNNSFHIKMKRILIFFFWWSKSIELVFLGPSLKSLSPFTQFTMIYFTKGFRSKGMFGRWQTHTHKKRWEGEDSCSYCFVYLKKKRETKTKQPIDEVEKREAMYVRVRVYTSSVNAASNNPNRRPPPAAAFWLKGVFFFSTCYLFSSYSSYYFLLLMERRRGERTTCRGERERDA